MISDFHTKQDMGVMFISHDLRVIKHICDKVVVVYRGNIVETGTVEEIFENPKMEYTKKLMGL